MVENKWCNYKYLHICNIGKKLSALSRSLVASKYFCIIGRIYARDELSNAEFILEDDLSISDDLASWDG